MSLITYKTVNSLLIRILSPSSCSAINCKRNDSEIYCTVTWRFMFQVKATAKSQVTIEGIMLCILKKSAQCWLPSTLLLRTYWVFLYNYHCIYMNKSFLLTGVNVKEISKLESRCSFAQKKSSIFPFHWIINIQWK